MHQKQHHRRTLTIMTSPIVKLDQEHHKFFSFTFYNGTHFQSNHFNTPKILKKNKFLILCLKFQEFIVDGFIEWH